MRLIAFLLVATAPFLRSAEPAAAKPQLTDVVELYTTRVNQAVKELADTRKRIASEREPAIQAMTALEIEVARLERAISGIDAAQADRAELRRALNKEMEDLNKTFAYMNSLGQDSLQAFERSLPLGEDQAVRDRLEGIKQRFEPPRSLTDLRPTFDGLSFILERIRADMGGRSVAGKSLPEGDTRVIPGRFAYFGPSTYFRANDGSLIGTVRQREGAPFPITYSLTGWSPEDATKVFKGELAQLPADASSGKALQLQKTSGTFLQHVHQGGVIAYVIIALGVVSLALIVWKVRDLRRVEVDAPATYESFLRDVAAGRIEDARALLGSMKPTTAALAETCLAHRSLPKDQLEDHLSTWVMRERLQAERHLPSLAVIATASPLTGLLGTVMGMVKTFALITVFGTGNATKLSSGISEVLVTTELGLAVAIPALIAHGLLTQRTHKRLALLERYAFEFVLAREAGKNRLQAALES